MIPRLVRLPAAFAVCLAALAVRAQPPSPTPLPTNPPAPGVNPAASAASNAAAEDQPVTVRLPDATLDTIIDALELYTGRVILRPAALPTTTYNIKISQPVPRSVAVRYIETVLALNGIAVIPIDERASKVVAQTMARVEAPEFITGSARDLPPSGRVATKLFQLDFIRVNEFAAILQGVLNPNYGGVQQLPNSNSALITDSISNLQRVELLLEQADRPVSGMKPRFYTLNNAKASDLVTKLRTILTGTLQTQLGSATTYSADDRTNQVILVTDPRQYEFFDELIQRLDGQADPNTRQDVIPLNHAKAEDVVNVIGQIIRGQSAALQQRQGSVRPGQVATPAPVQPGQAPAPQIIGANSAGNPNADQLGASNEFSATMTVVNDNRTNSVVVSGTANDIRLLRDLVKKLDIVLAQVRIEVVIAEVALDDDNQTGISALGLKLEGDKLVGFSGSAAGVAITDGTVTRPGLDLAATIALSTTPRKNNSTILTHPALTTSHGQKSTIFSGETRPVVTGTISSAVGGTNGLSSQSTVNQQQIGTRLDVTPFIGADGSVQLDLTQTVEDVTGEVKVDNNTQYIIGRRETKSYVTAKSGDIIVLGGFQKITDLKSTNRLGPIPIIGDLLGSRRKHQTKGELIFFLRPVVLTNDPKIDNAEALRKIEGWPHRESVKQQLDPTYVPPKPSLLDKILPK
jgi:general secretion pathway protein D